MDAYGNCLDRELINFLKKGDGEAFTEIYTRYWKSLFNTAYKRLPEREICEDIVQNVFIDLWERRENSEVENLAAYLHTAIRFQIFKISSRSPLKSEFLAGFDNILASQEHTDDPLLENEILNIVSLWIDTLPEKRREIFMLHYFQELPSQEIASKLNISRKTVQNLLNITSKAVREQIIRILLTLLLPYFFS